MTAQQKTKIIQTALALVDKWRDYDKVWSSLSMIETAHTIRVLALVDDYLKYPTFYNRRRQELMIDMECTMQKMFSSSQALSPLWRMAYRTLMMTFHETQTALLHDWSAVLELNNKLHLEEI